MEELKKRQAVVNAVVDGHVPIQRIVGHELAYLQLRFICEIIALGCLVAHGDDEKVRTGKLERAYKADWIIKALEELHPEFYPRPGKQALNSAGRPVRVDPVKEPYLAKNDLVALYRECGKQLHRGNLRTLESREGTLNFPRIKTWSVKIARLLNHHALKLKDSDRELWVIMQAREDGNVHVHEMHRVGPAPK